jgi:hypothetical protein
LLAKVILESPQRLPISPHLLFYVLCRKVLRETHVKSREAADFVASVLEGFMRMPRMEATDETGKRSMQYLSDIMQATNNAGTREAFLLRSHAANYALFISGLFADNVEKRTRQRGAPDLSFYEAVGQMNYRAASEYQEAKKFKLQVIYEELASGFREVRLALNDLASRLLHLDSSTAPIIAS